MSSRDPDAAGTDQVVAVTGRCRSASKHRYTASDRRRFSPLSQVPASSQAAVARRAAVCSVGLGVGHHHPHGAAWQRAWACASPGVGHLASVSSSAGHRHRGHGLLHCRDVRLTTLDVLFFIELGTRQVRLAGVIDHPSGSWVVQRAREFSMEAEGEGAEGATTPRFLIRDRDSKFTRAFDDVFASDGTRVIMTLSRRRMPTRSRSAGCGRSGRSVWTGC